MTITMAIKSDGLVTPRARVSKRKRVIDYNEAANDSEKENVVEEDVAPPKKKKSKAASKPGPKPKNNTKEATKLYNNTIKAIDREVKKYDAILQKLTGRCDSFTTDDYAESVVKHFSAFRELVKLDRVMAFNLLLSMADASHTDLDSTIKASGFGESEGAFAHLDGALVVLIEGRDKPTEAQHATELPPVPHRWTYEDAAVGVFKTGYPNKQQRNEMHKQKLDWERDRTERRRQRRVDEEDWVKVALSDLVEERDYLKEYGVERYLPTSIASLEYLVAQRGLQ